MNITAVIPVYNRLDLLHRLLATVRAQTLPFTDVIVVDNGSDGDVEGHAAWAGCRLIRMGENAGFARAVNAGWRAAQTEWVAILNSDVELDPAWSERLAAGVGDAGFATGLIVNASDERLIDGTYDLVSRAGCAWRAGHSERVSRPVSRPIAVAPGTACLFHRAVLDRMGGFDDTFGSYLEDVDLGLRCLAAGIGGVFVSDALARHQGSATLGRWNPEVVRLISRNQVRLVARHWDTRLFRECFWAVLVGQGLWGLVALRHGAAMAWLRGKWQGIGEFHLERATASDSLRRFLMESEGEIRQRAHDSYWRWYFLLAGRG